MLYGQAAETIGSTNGRFVFHVKLHDFETRDLKAPWLWMPWTKSGRGWKFIASGLRLWPLCLEMFRCGTGAQCNHDGQIESCPQNFRYPTKKLSYQKIAKSCNYQYLHRLLVFRHKTSNKIMGLPVIEYEDIIVVRGPESTSRSATPLRRPTKSKPMPPLPTAPRCCRSDFLRNIQKWRNQQRLVSEIPNFAAGREAVA